MFQPPAAQGCAAALQGGPDERVACEGGGSGDLPVPLRPSQHLPVFQHLCATSPVRELAQQGRPQRPDPHRCKICSESFLPRAACSACSRSVGPRRAVGGRRWLWCIVVALHDPEAECNVSAVQYRGLPSLHAPAARPRCTPLRWAFLLCALVVGAGWSCQDSPYD